MIRLQDVELDYRAPDGAVMSGTFTGAPKSDTVSGFEWSGEWVVTYETFRDLGLASGEALGLAPFAFLVQGDPEEVALFGLVIGVP